MKGAFFLLQIVGSGVLPPNATRDFKASPEATAAFGPEFTEHFACSRDWEVREYERHVNDWQLQRYFELI